MNIKKFKGECYFDHDKDERAERFNFNSLIKKDNGDISVEISGRNNDCGSYSVNLLMKKTNGVYSGSGEIKYMEANYQQTHTLTLTIKESDIFHSHCIKGMWARQDAKGVIPDCAEFHGELEFV